MKSAKSLAGNPPAKNGSYLPPREKKPHGKEHEKPPVKHRAKRQKAHPGLVDNSPPDNIREAFLKQALGMAKTLRQHVELLTKTLDFGVVSEATIQIGWIPNIVTNLRFKLWQIVDIDNCDELKGGSNER